jgi:hypothetical protein
MLSKGEKAEKGMKGKVFALRRVVALNPPGLNPERQKHGFSKPPH